ncbi:hypothetical protein SKAU_G00404030 [Synaphobranchus kaupii]|uniref:Sialin n=1 Tax=Synaphobranchus kaupii TaxID=118154 RepID=A0A9Q1E9L7_SYNKA|nr:hypothetical protein SKAU_G00404030 [Synaphobranchus kaupii]
MYFRVTWQTSLYICSSLVDRLDLSARSIRVVMALNQGYSINAASNDHDDEATPLLEKKVPDTAAFPLCCSARGNLATLMFLGFAVVYGLRVNLSVAMVAMVNGTSVHPSTNHSPAHECPGPPSGLGNSSSGPEQPDGVPQYSWDSDTQGYLLGAFFFGYLLTQIPGGVPVRASRRTDFHGRRGCGHGGPHPPHPIGC